MENRRRVVTFTNSFIAQYKGEIIINILLFDSWNVLISWKIQLKVHVYVCMYVWTNNLKQNKQVR